MADTVRAAVMNGPGDLSIEEYPWPDLEPGALLMKVEYCGICGTDKHAYRGELVHLKGTEAEFSTAFPLIPGHEMVGTVAEITPGAATNIEYGGQALEVGDRIAVAPSVLCGHCYYCRHPNGYPYCVNQGGYGNTLSAAEPPHLFGGWAEHMYVLPQAYVYKIPDELPSEIAVYVELMACAFALDRAQQASLMDGFNFADTLLIQGAGPLGVAHLIKARMMGAGRIVMLDASDFRLNLAREFGADLTLNIESTSEQERLDAIRDFTQGRGVDLAVECTGRPEAFVEGLNLVRRNGTYIVEGLFIDMGEVMMNPNLICGKSLNIMGISGHPMSAYIPAMEMMVRHLNDMPLDRYVTHKFPLDHAEEALKASMAPDTMKVVIAP